MPDENQISLEIKRLFETKNFDKLKLIILEYYSNTASETDSVYATLKKFVSRGFARDVAELIEFINESFPLVQLLPLLADAYEKSAHYEKAATVYEKLTKIAPNEISHISQCAINLQKAEKYGRAILFYEKILEQESENLFSLYNLGFCYRKIEDWENATKFFKKYVELNQSDAKGYYNLGVISEKTLDYQLAEEYYRKAISLDNTHQEAHWNYALILLRKKQYNGAWPEFEWRRKMPFFKNNSLRIKEWNGENVTGKKLVVYSEQGFGDVIQFMRFVKPLKVIANKVVLFVPNELIRLLKATDFVDDAISDVNALDESEFDFKLPILSVPFLINAKKDEIEISQSLFNIAPNENNKNEKIKIGVVWRGNPNHENSKYRDIPLDLLKGLFVSFSNVEVNSLQVDLKDEERKILSESNISDLTLNVNDFYDTARIILSLDIVITVDTAVAHLSGSLFKETLLLVPLNNDWRWGNGEEITDWYPTVKVFRQSTLGDWSLPFQKIKRELTSKSKMIEPKLNRSNIESIAAKYYNNGYYEKSLQYFKRIVDVFGDARSYNNYGLALQATGKINDAEAAFKQAVNIDKTYVKGYLNLINCFNQSQRNSEAVVWLTKGIEHTNRNSELIYQLAVNFHKQKLYNKALPLYAEIYFTCKEANYLADYSTLLVEMEKLNEAEKIIDEYSRKNGFTERYFFIKGNIFTKKEEYDKAEDYYLKALEINPDFYDAKLNLASLFFLQRKIDESERLYFALLKEKKEAQIYYNLGVIKQEKREFNESLKFFNNAISIEPNAEFNFAKAEILLIQKNFESGLVLYEERLKFLKTFVTPKLPSNWNDLRNKNILIFEEQGIGDTFQFVRFVLPLREIASEITLAVRDKMISFWKSQKIADEVISLTNPNTDEFDFVIPIVSLFYLWFNTFKQFPPKSKYVSAEKLPRLNLGRKKIAIAWKGNPNPIYHRKRHMMLKELLPVIKSVDAEFFILQNDLNEEEEKIVIDNNNLHYLSDVVNDWEELTSMILSVDLVLTIDTVYAHLSGAMGKMVFLMLPYSADWRWGSDDTSSYWYESVKLFRQKEMDNWGNVIDDVLMNIHSITNE